MTCHGVNGNCARRPSDGFTLIELIAVMFVLAGILAVSAPSLGRFFKQRSMKDEIKQILALTRFAQSEAISEGAPMTVWFDPELNEYGLRREDGMELTTGKRRVYPLNKDFEMEPWSARASSQDNRNLAMTFLPDGLPAETSLAGLRLQHRLDEDQEYYLVLAENRLRYEIRKINEMQYYNAPLSEANPNASTFMSTGVHLR